MRPTNSKPHFEVKRQVPNTHDTPLRRPLSHRFTRLPLERRPVYRAQNTRDQRAATRKGSTSSPTKACICSRCALLVPSTPGLFLIVRRRFSRCTRYPHPTQRYVRPNLAPQTTYLHSFRGYILVRDASTNSPLGCIQDDGSEGVWDITPDVDNALVFNLPSDDGYILATVRRIVYMGRAPVSHATFQNSGTPQWPYLGATGSLEVTGGSATNKPATVDGYSYGASDIGPGVQKLVIHHVDSSVADCPHSLSASS